MRLERERRRGAQRPRHLRPRGVEHLIAGPRAASERLDEPPLAIEAMSQVLLDPLARAPHERPVPGAEHLEIELPQPAQRVEIGRHRALPRSDEHAPLTQDRVAGEEDPAEEQADVVGRMAGRGERPEGSDLLSLGGSHDRDPAAALGQYGRALGMVGMGVGQHDAGERAAGRAARHRLRHPVEVSPVVRSRVDDPIPDHVGVRPVQGQG